MENKSKKILLMDFGCTSVLGLRCAIENHEMQVEEVCRKPYATMCVAGEICCDFPKMLDTVVEMIEKCGTDISAVGIDAWGVDYGVIDPEGHLIEMPRNYRDAQFGDSQKELRKRLPDRDVYAHTGNQIWPFLTLYQLNAMRLNRPDTFRKIKTCLFLPDLLQYHLTGQTVCDETMLATSGFYNIKAHRYSRENLDAIGVSEKMFPPIVTPGHLTGNTANALDARLRKYALDVYTVCGHDMAGAVLATEAFYDKNTVFVNAGTWSLIGAVNRQPVTDEKSYALGITNEIAYAGGEVVLKNVTGFYLLEKYKAQMEKACGRTIGFDEIEAYVAKDRETYALVDMNDPAFAEEDYCARKRIDDVITRQGHADGLPREPFGYYTLLYRSLAETYKTAIKALSACTGVPYKKIVLIGGGAKSDFFAHLVESVTEMCVERGPGEATALGNALVIFKARGDIASIKEGQRLIRAWENRK